MYLLIIRPRAKKQLKELPLKYRKKIDQAFSYIATDPFTGKKLNGKRAGEYSLRVWPYRIIYAVEKEKVTVYVLAVGHRQGIY